MRFALSVVTLIIVGSCAAAADAGLRFTTIGNYLPTMKAIVVVKAGEPGPGVAKHKAVAETAKYKETVNVPGEGPYDVYWLGKNGIAVRVVAAIKVKVGEVLEVKIGDHVGIVNFRGDNQPRVALVTIAPQDDPGPDEKGHRAIQTAKDYREDMVVPDGYYSLWITPENGARPRKVNDRFRVQAGKTVQLD
jgi:hypothetical protein